MPLLTSLGIVMNYKTDIKPPKPPENYLVCEACGYKAKISEFDHKYCPMAITIITAGVVFVLGYISLMVITFLHKFGII